MMPSNITVGSGTGLAMVLHETLLPELSVSAIAFIMNAILLILGFIKKV
jgi:hypothetical protein